MPIRRPRAGVTLIEVLVVIGLIGVLVGLVLPAVQNTRAAAGRAACQNNLKQIGIALHNYSAVYGRLPPGPHRRIPGRLGSDPNELLTWQALILPMMDQAALWDAAVAACQTDNLPFHNPPHTGYGTVVRGYVCPADPRLRDPLTEPQTGDEAAYTSYMGVAGYTDGRGMFGDRPGCRLTDVTDGASNTLAVGERPPPDSLQAGRWYPQIQAAWLVPPPGIIGPDQFMQIWQSHDQNDAQCSLALSDYGPGRTANPCDRRHFWSLHPGGANFLLADGSVRFFQYGARGVLPALATRAGGEVVGDY